METVLRNVRDIDTGERLALERMLGQTLREDQQVIIHVVTPAEEAPLPGSHGSGAAVLAALATSPQVPASWVDELEQLIAQGRRPPTRKNPFPDEPGSQEG